MDETAFATEPETNSCSSNLKAPGINHPEPVISLVCIKALTIKNANHF